MRSRRTRARHFHTATVANDAAMFDALIFSAGTFPILDGTENAFAKQAPLFRFECAVIDRLRVLHFTLGPGTDRFGSRDGDRDVLHEIYLVQPEHLAG